MRHRLEFCEDSDPWYFFESWFSPFSRCFEWTVLCYTPFVYASIGSCYWIYMRYFRYSCVLRPRKPLSLWTPLQFSRSALVCLQMIMFFFASVFGEILFYSALYAEQRGETTHFVPLASIVYDVIHWLSCILMHVLHYLHRDVGRQTSSLIISYWTLVSVCELPAYYRTWMDLFSPAVVPHLSPKSIFLHTITFPLILASLAINIFILKKTAHDRSYENIPGYNRKRSMTR